MSRTFPQLAPWIVPAALWLWLCAQLSVEWSINPAYHYGWVVPVLAAVLFASRWPGRPNPDPRARGRSGAMLILFTLLPLRIIEEANPDWRLLDWALALAVVGWSLLAIYRAGGAAWARHFAFPICFPLVAVPWPVPWENFLIQTLSRGIAAAAADLAGWCGIAAVPRGNIIELRNGFVGVDEACSGIKTLQAAIMISLFLGELLRLRPARRWLLLGAGCAWVLACNVGRASALVLIAGTRGIPEIARWHDTLGIALLLAGTLGLCAIAFSLQESKWHPASASLMRMPARPLAPVEWIAPLAWIAFVFACSESWFRAHERHLLARSTWEIAPPGESLPIADSTRAILRYNRAHSSAWRDAEGANWWLFFARWNPGRAAAALVRSHSPEICLPASGRTFRREWPPVTVAAGGTQLPFRVYEFEEEGRPLFVFLCVVEDKFSPASDPSTEPNWNAAGRLAAAWNGERNLGQRLLELAVTGIVKPADAERALAKTVAAIVRPLPPTKD